MERTESATLKEKLLQDWRRISDVVALAGRDSSRPEEAILSLTLRSPLPEESLREIARRWVSIFDEEIETVLLVRNAIVHGHRIDEGSLKETVRLAEDLLETLNEKTESATERSAAAG